MDAGIRLVVDNSHKEIEDLEAEIEALADAAARCRKILAGARALVIAGCLLFVGFVLGILRFDALALVLGLAAVPAGIALYGSNRRTLDDLQADIAKRTEKRRAIIDGLDLRPTQH
jgi:hypothetical protein